MWRCVKCGEKLDDSFDTCWQCGTSNDGVEDPKLKGVEEIDAAASQEYIRCIPKGICSWNYCLDGEGNHATLEFNWLGEQGAIIANGTHFDVRKNGMFSGHWTLERANQELASAQKTGVFGRSFEMQTPVGLLSLNAAYAIGRTFRLERTGDVLAIISPVHPFTRRASIQTTMKEYDFPIISFAFWIAALTWRRAAAQSSGGG